MNTRLTRSAAVAAGLIALAVGTGAPAFAHDTPARGSTCRTSGMVEIDHGKVYVCTVRKVGAEPTWVRGRTISRSPLTMVDGWAKAADTGMSAAFGTVRNPTSRPIRIVGAVSSSSKVLQLHEVVAKDGSMVMQQRMRGFVIPAGGSLELKPGGSHVMFMSLTKPIKAGDLVPLMLITSDGGLLRTKVLGKVFSGANEDYLSGSSGASAMSGR